MRKARPAIQNKFMTPAAMLIAFRRAWDWLLDQLIAAGLGILDWLEPKPEAPVDQAIREAGERLRKVFPTVDFDNPALRKLPQATIGLENRQSDGCRTRARRSGPIIRTQHCPGHKNIQHVSLQRTRRRSVHGFLA
jgi:hypothetical protein